MRRGLNVYLLLNGITIDNKLINTPYYLSTPKSLQNLYFNDLRVLKINLNL